ncbi:MAG: hypothetical protein DIU68_016645 [Chloroflexota bacterium]
MFDQYRLTIMTFPQRFDGSNLSLNVLILPQLSTQWNGNPLLDLPLGYPNPASMGVPFAESELALELRLTAGPDGFPKHDPVDAVLPLATQTSFPDAVALYTELQSQFQIKDTVSTADLAEAPKASLKVRKYVAPSYRVAAGFTRPRIPEIVTDDSYHCAIREAKEPNPAFQPSSNEVTWGKVYAYCLRHPLLARRLGLIREATVALDSQLLSLMETEGIFYVTLAQGSSYLDNLAPNEHFNFVRHYAARVPALEAGTARPLFAAALFPVLFGVASPDGNYDQVFIDAAEYDDGFAKVVHTNQPISQNLLVEDDDGFPPVHDIGIRMAWDDERVCEWQNRQLKEREDQPGTGKRLDAPMGVFGYRIDARLQGEAQWRSLTAVQSKGDLQLGPINLGTYTGELAVEVHPMQLDGDQANSEFWLPIYFAQWNGKSLVLPDEDAAALYKTEQAASQAVVLGRLYNPVGLESIPLRYGNIYEFRVRLMDATSGGPELSEEPVYEAQAPVATTHFKRFVQPEPLRMDGLPRVPDEPLDTYFAGDSLTIHRPLLGYPSVVFTGKYADPIPLLQAASDAAQGVGSFGIPDPDVLRVQIDVEVRALDMDNRLSLSGTEPFIHLYRTFRDFPASFDEALSIPLTFVQANVLNFGDPADLGDLGVSQDELDEMAELVLPRGREIRLTLRGLGDGDSDYYGRPGTHIGKPVQLKVRRESEDERELLANLSPARQIRGIYLQPDPPQPNDGRLQTWLFRRGAASTPAIIQRLAQQLDVNHKGLTLVGEKGQRVIFGCSNRIRHTLAPDHSSITFASKDELLNHWVVALTYQVDRDWTWDMLEEVSFELFRELKYQGDDEIDDNGGRPIGDLEMKHTVPVNALQNPDRSRTTLIYLDAVEPKSTRPNPDDPAETAFPDIIELSYTLRPRFRTPPAQQDEPAGIELTLPVTTPPAQVPRILSAGIALSPYRRNDDYSATEPRERYLWLEFEEPVRDPNDSYFIRLLAYSPDPLLSDNRLETFVAPDEPPLGIDPELIRVITPGQSDDQAGLAAMQPLEPATSSDRHYLLPLPPGLHTESMELFGFFTYEIRVGHARIWSTAQGRFGRPLRTTGVQHPAPTLFCTCHRDEVRLLVEAPHAIAVLNGKNITASPPRTELWALLYAQVRQADGLDNRNILLDDRRLDLIPPVYREVYWPEGGGALAKSNRNGPAWSSTEWSDEEIKALLSNLGLPVDASLSVVCVEMLPRFAAFQREARTTTAVLNQERGRDAIIDGVRASRGNAFAPGGPGIPGGPPEPDIVRPLSSHLGHFRILRTSPLTPVPDVC